MQLTYLSVKTHYSNPDSLKSKINRSPSKPEQYLQECETENIVFSENGNFYNWTEKHELSKKYNKKYVHSVTVRVAEKLSRSTSVPHYLFNLMAMNYEGAMELNRLVGLSFAERQSDDPEPHFYFEPRISLAELVSVSENIIVIADPINNPYWQKYQANMIEEIDNWDNKLKALGNRFWVGVSSRSDRENKFAIETVKKYCNQLLYMDNVYSHNESYEAVRHVLNKAQNENYEEDDSQRFLKSYEDILFNLEQIGLNKEEVDRLINAANELYNCVQEFDLDPSIKYPHVSDNPLRDIQKRIVEGYNERKLHLLPKGDQLIYKNRINHELSVMTKVQAIDYMLLEYEIKSDMRNNFNIYPGPGRGSVGGSLIAYLLHITSVDPIKHNLLFERFINEDRVDVQDIDSDFAPNDRNVVQQYLLEHEKYTCASIITFGTLGLKGGFKEIGEALGYDYQVMNAVTKSFPMEGGTARIPSSVRDDYSDIMSYLNMIEGIVVNVGRHAAGIIVSDRDLPSEIGTLKVKDFEHNTSFIDMNEIGRLQYVKLDILGLRNIEHINLAAQLAGLERVDTTSEYIDYNDWNIAEDIANNGADTIFQFDSESTQSQAKKIFSKNTLKNIHKNYPNITIIELMSILTAVIRPGSASIMDSVVNGITHDNGIEALNEILKDSYGWMIYQEQSIAYLKFVGFSGSEADTIRRAIGKKKKQVIDDTVPEIRERSIEIITNKYGVKYEEAVDIVDAFMQIFLDSAMYSFNKSHAIEYSYISYQAAWLRYYYPLEWITAGLITWSDNLDKINNLTKLANAKGIKMDSIKFRYSKGDYFFDKATNTIYQGTAPIKGNNKTVGDMLYENFRDKKYTYFCEFLLDLKEVNESVVYVNGDSKPMFKVLTELSEDEVKSLDKELKNKKEKTCWIETSDKYPINKTQILSLIRLGYFSEFGGARKLEQVWEEFDKRYKPSNKTLLGKSKHLKEILRIENELPNEENTVFDQCQYELEYLKRVEVKNAEISAKFGFVVEILKVTKQHVRALVHLVNRGKTIQTKTPIKLYRSIEFDTGDIIEINKAEAKPRPAMIDGKWGKDPTKKDFWIMDAKTIRRGG